MKKKFTKVNKSYEKGILGQYQEKGNNSIIFAKNISFLLPSPSLASCFKQYVVQWVPISEIDRKI